MISLPFVSDDLSLSEPSSLVDRVWSVKGWKHWWWLGLSHWDVAQYTSRSSKPKARRSMIQEQGASSGRMSSHTTTVSGCSRSWIESENNIRIPKSSMLITIRLWCPSTNLRNNLVRYIHTPIPPRTLFGSSFGNHIAYKRRDEGTSGCVLRRWGAIQLQRFCRMRSSNVKLVQWSLKLC